MDPFQIYAAHIIAYSLFPIYIATRKNPLRLIYFYIYISLLLVMGGFLGAVYALPLTESVSLSGGSLAYGALMMSAVVMLVREHNIALIRNIIKVVVGVNILLVMIFSLISWSLGSNEMVIPYPITPPFFAAAAEYLMIQGLLIILELGLLIYLFERIKTKINSFILLSVILVLVFILVLCLDGALRPMLASTYYSSSPSTIVKSVVSTCVLAVSYSLPLMAFLLLFQNRLEEYQKVPIPLRNLFTPPRKEMQMGFEVQVPIQSLSNEDLIFRSNLIDRIGEAVIATDLEGKLIFWNQEAERIYGWTRSEVLGRNILEVIPSEESINEAAAIMSKLEQGETWKGGFRVRRKNGESFPAWVTDSPITDANGSLIGIIGVSRDITEQQETENALRKSEEKFRNLYETMSQGVIYYDFEGSFTSVNPSAERILGLSLEQMQELTFQNNPWHAIHEDGRDFPEDQHPSIVALRTGKVVRNVVMGVFNSRIDGYKWININAIPQTRPGESSPIQVYTTFEDITQLIHERRALEDSKEELDRFFNLVPDLVCIASIDGYYIKVNAAWERTLGFTAEELYSKPFTHFIHPEDVQSSADDFAEQFSGQVPPPFINRYRTKDGDYRWLEWVSAPAVAGKFLYSAARDISDRRAAEIKLTESEMKYRSLVETIGDLIWSLDSEGVFTFVNKASEKIYGYKPDEIIGRHWSEFISAADIDYANKTAERTHQSNGIVEEAITTVCHRDGRQILLRSQATQIQDGEGNRVGSIGISQDITNLIKMEQEIRRSREQLRAYTDKLQSAIEEERTHIAREIHDEFGQMMTGLKMDLAAFKRSISPESEFQARIRTMDDLVDAAIKIIRRISSELRPGVLDDLGLCAALEWQAEDFSRRSGISCSASLPAEEPDLEPDLKTTIYRIFQESLTNIARHAGATEVKASLNITSDELTMQVADNGRGISAAELSQSSSLGLTGMRERAAQWSGSVSISGARSQGTIVHLKIPLPAEKRSYNEGP